MNMTWKEFHNKYKFEDHNGSPFLSVDASRIDEIENKLGGDAWRYVWTLCFEGDEEYYVGGFAIINRANYLVATVPHNFKDGDDNIVELIEETETT